MSGVCKIEDSKEQLVGTETKEEARKFRDKTTKGSPLICLLKTDVTYKDGKLTKEDTLYTYALLK